MLNKADSKSDVILVMHHIRNYKDISCINNNLQCYNENEDCKEATVQQTAAKHQKTFISCGKAMKAVLYLHYKPVLMLFSCSKSIEHGRAHSTNSSINVKKYTHV
jgi:hypothetical protein